MYTGYTGASITGLPSSDLAVLDPVPKSLLVAEFSIYKQSASGLQVLEPMLSAV